MAIEYKLSYTASEINEKLRKIDDIDVGSSAILLRVPTLIGDSTEYTEEDKTAIRTVINQIALASKPVVILYYNGSYMPANYLCVDTHHYFTVIATDEAVGENRELYLVYIDFDTSNNTLIIRNDISVGGGDTTVCVQEEEPTDVADGTLWLDTGVDGESNIGISISGLPAITAEDEDKMIQIVDGRYTLVSIKESSIATYIDEYINEALGGDY